jgi:transcriptional regulator with XRE-family HTH domain
VPDRLAAAVGKRVRALRKAQDFSYDAFVEECGLGRGYVSELERGLVVPSLHALAKVAKTLDVTVADLVLGDSDREHLFDAARDLTAADIRDLLVETRRRAATRARA